MAAKTVPRLTGQAFSTVWISSEPWGLEAVNRSMGLAQQADATLTNIPHSAFRTLCHVRFRRPTAWSPLTSKAGRPPSRTDAPSSTL